MTRARTRLSPFQALICLGLLTQTGLAAATNIFSSNATVTFSYRLIDLNPTDGIAASVTFLASDPETKSLFTVTTIGELVSSQSSTVTGNVFTTSGVFSTSNPDASISKVNDQVTTRSNLSQEKLTGLVNEHADDAQWFRYNESADFFGTQILKLGANTRIEVYATLDVQPSVDRSALLSIMADGPAELNSIVARSSTLVYGELQGSMSTSPSVSITNTDGFYTDAGGTSYDVNYASSNQTFMISASNFGPVADTALLSLGVMSASAFQLNTGVPEPSTYALHGLGLLALGVAVRRHRRKHSVAA